MQHAPRGLIKIHKSELGHAAREFIKNSLTVVPELKSLFGSVPDPIRLWVDEGDFLFVPRGFYNSVIKKRFDPKIEFQFSSGTSELRPNDPITLREGQGETIEAAIASMQAHPFGGAIIEAPTGSGKSPMSMEVARRLGMKTLFVVHTTVLMEQWIKAMRKFMPNWSVGKIQADTCDVKNNDVCIAMLQSLALGKDYPEWVYDEFGLIVFDECHIAGASEFQKALYKFRSKYVMGVSGTLKRKDRAENVFKYGVGDVIPAMNKIEILKPVIYAVDTGYSWSDKGNKPIELQRGNFLHALISDGARNEIIVQNTLKAVKAGRHVIVLSERVGHVEALYRDLFKRLHGTGIKVGMMVGSSSKEQREFAETAQVLVATVQLLAVGFDNPRLDTLVMATPIQGMTQACVPNDGLVWVDGNLIEIGSVSSGTVCIGDRQYDITSAMRRKNGGYIYDIKSLGVDTVSLTGEHPIFVRRWKKSVGLTPDEFEVHASVLHGYLNSEEHSVDVASSSRLYIGLPVCGITNESHDLNKNRARLVGYFAAEGTIYRNKKRNMSGRVSFSFNANGEEDFIIEVEAIIKKEFNLQTVRRTRRGCTTVYCHSTDLCRWIETYVSGRQPVRKFSNTLMTVGKELQAEVVNAAWNGDGDVVDGYWRYNSSSKIMSLQIQMLLLRNGKVAFYRIVDHSRDVSRFSNKPMYEVTMPLNRKRISGAILEGDILWTAIKSSSKRRYTGIVCNFSVDGIERYSTSGGMVHNCGRILRQHPDKKPPIVVDLVDSRSQIGKKMGQARFWQYNAKGWKVQFPPGLFQNQ